jgi:hypothetical protein
MNAMSPEVRASLTGYGLRDVSTLLDARSRGGVNGGGGVLRASGKAVSTWPPEVAVDAGPMQIQLWEATASSHVETVLQGAT